MALIYEATLTPSKLELLSGWLPSRPWFSGPPGVTQVGAYRLDDPAGEVGLEGFLLQSGSGSLLHVPLTYRAAPLDGAELHLVGTMEHSVLGKRYVYDACGDPVWAAALATTVLTGGTQAELLVHGQSAPREPTVTVAGSGTAGTPVGEIDTVSCHDDGPTTVMTAGSLELVVVRVVGADVPTEQTLTARWAEGESAVLAGVRSG